MNFAGGVTNFHHFILAFALCLAFLVTQTNPPGPEECFYANILPRYGKKKGFMT